MRCSLYSLRIRRFYCALTCFIIYGFFLGWGYVRIRPLTWVLSLSQAKKGLTLFLRLQKEYDKYPISSYFPPNPRITCDNQNNRSSINYVRRMGRRNFGQDPCRRNLWKTHAMRSDT